MRLAIAHNNSPYFAVVDTTDWSKEAGTPTLAGHAWAVDFIGSKSAIAIGHTTSPSFTLIDSNDYSSISYTITSSLGNVLAFAVSPDESRLALGSTSNIVVILDTATWTEVDSINMGATVRSLDYSPNGEWLAVGYDSSPYLKVFATADLTEVFAASEFTAYVDGVSFSPDSSRLAAIPNTFSGSAAVYNTATWGSPIAALSYSGNGRTIVYSRVPGNFLALGHTSFPRITVYNAETLEQIEEVPSASNDVRGVAFSPGDQFMSLGFTSSPYYAVRHTSDWTSAIDADFPASIAGVSTAQVFIPDNSGGYALTAPMSTFDAAGTFDAADNVASHAATAPMITYDSAAVVTELHEADYAVDAIVPTFDSHAQLEIRSTYAVAAPMAEIDYTAITGLEIEQPLPFETTLDPIRLGFGFTGDAFELDSSAVFSVATHFISRMASSSEMDTALKGGMTFSEVASMADAATISHVLAMLDTLGLSGSEDIKHIKAMIFLSEMVSESELPLPNINAAVNLASALTLRSFDAYGVQIEEISTMELAAAFDLRYTAVLAAMSDMELASTATLNTRVHAVFLSTMEQDGTFDSQALLQMEFESLLGGYSVLQIGDDVYEGWVVNIGEERRGGKDVAMSTYENYPFTAITMFKGKPYGIAADGLYLLEGDSDDGAAVQAALKTGLLDLGQRQLKDAKALYLGYTSDGQLVLKVTTTSGGKKREDWYRLRHGEADDMRTSRVTIQRGLRSTYWQFELCNVDGADFELDDVTLVYQLMTRRIRR